MRKCVQTFVCVSIYIYIYNTHTHNTDHKIYLHYIPWGLAWDQHNRMPPTQEGRLRAWHPTTHACPHKIARLQRSLPLCPYLTLFWEFLVPGRTHNTHMPTTILYAFITSYWDWRCRFFFFNRTSHTLYFCFRFSHFLAACWPVTFPSKPISFTSVLYHNQQQCKWTGMNYKLQYSNSYKYIVPIQ